VKLDKDLGENEIFLGGNYGSFGWVGFHNGELTLEANTEIGLLESVTTNPWTYADVYNFVGEFICGVGDVDDALNGATVTVDGVEYNFGEATADVETRLDILAAIEGKVLESYNYLPMLLDGSMALLSQQVYYVVEEYNPVLGRGGIQYMKYNYDDAEWAAYVAEQGGELKY
jgi:hypothetical protein